MRSVKQLNFAHCLIKAEKQVALIGHTLLRTRLRYEIQEDNQITQKIKK